MTSRHLSADRPGERLDVFLSRSLPDLSRAHAQRLIHDGCVHVSGATAKASLRLEFGACVQVTTPPPRTPPLEPEPIPLVVVYDDADLAVINKPPGMAVHPSPGHERSTLVHALLARFPDLSGIEGNRPGIIHRLDKDTSGLLLVAKSDRARVSLSAQMAARTVQKHYLALVKGEPPSSGTIDAPIDRDPTERKRMAVVTGGRSARTHFRTLARIGAVTLIAVTLETGRTHQIRVHCAAIGHPVVGDTVYGSRSDLTPRQFLHAWRLGFRHPRTDEWHHCEAPLPDDLYLALQVAMARVAVPDGDAEIVRVLLGA